jgi:arylformamidase
MPSEPVAEPEDLAPAAQPVATAPVYQAQPVYAAPTPQAPVAEQEYSAPAPEPVQQSVPEPVQQPVYTAPAYAPPAQPVYAAPVQQSVQAAPVAQPVYLPSNALPLQSALPPMQAAPAPLPTLNPPTKAERKRAKANQQDRAIVAAAAQGMPTQNPLSPLNPLNPWIDVSAALSPAITPVYEGNPPLQVKFTMDMEHGAALDLSQIDMGTHTGTHVDAPLHFVRGAPSIDEVPLDRLIGPAVVLDIDPRVIAITGAELMKYKWQGAKRVIFRTRNSVNSWIIDPQFHRDFTFLAPDAAQMLADNGVLLVGIDYLSIEQFGAFKPLTHQILLSRGIPIVEGLDLRTVIPGEYDFMVLPLKILGHEAAPARAVLRAR